MRMTIQHFRLMAACLLAGFLLALPTAVAAQDSEEAKSTALFAYFSHEAVLGSLTQLAGIESQMAALRDQYQQEMKRVEEEFNAKYEEFLESQRSLAPSIYKKRQAELTDLLQRNIAFKAEAQQQLEKARAEAIAPLRQKISDAVAVVAKKHGYAFVLNTDNNSLTYADPTLGADITQEVLAAVKP